MQRDPRGSVELGHDHHAAFVTCGVQGSEPRLVVRTNRLPELLNWPVTPNEMASQVIENRQRRLLQITDEFLSQNLAAVY